VASAFWAPSLVTDASGTATFEFVAPDNLTAFRLMAVAADSGDRFGKTDQRITVNKPLMAQPVLPRFLAAGDQATVGVLVYNRTGAAGKATVTGRASGGATLSAGGKAAGSAAPVVKTIDIPDGGSARVDFATAVGEAASASYEFSVALGRESDALRMTVPINRPRLIDTRTLTQGVLGGGVQTVETDLAWDKAVLPAESALAVTVDRTGLGDLEPSLRYLVEYPYGCLEQTLSRFIPLVKVKDLSKTLALKGLEGPELERFIAAGAAKVVRHQHADGNFSLWPSSEAQPFLTVYAIYGLTEAKRAGVAVDGEAIERGIAALKLWANSGDRKLGPGGELGTMAMAAYLFAEVRQPDSGLDARLYEARAGLPAYGKAFLLRAMDAAGADARLVRTLKDELVAAATVDGASAILRDASPDNDFYMNSDIRASSIALSALLEVDPKHPMVEKLAEGVRRGRNAAGRWGNTQDNFYALVALADYARDRAAGTLAVTISVGGKEVAKRTVSGSQVVSYRAGLDGVAPGKISIAVDGAAHYAARVTEARKEMVGQPAAHGIEVTRSYLDAKGKPISKVKAGEVVKVVVTVKMPSGARYLALVDPLPGGFEAINDKFATSANTVGDPDGDGESEDDDEGGDKDWYGWRTWTNIELHDDEVQAFSDWMGSDELTLRYDVRATIAGSFVAPPARAELMYEPQVNGRTAAGTVTIVR
jgi:uncharacterized protein YfaS (alpha-2-macroglobulin family)